MSRTAIILFFFALSVAFAMVTRKIWLLRSGRIVPGSYEEADWTELSIESIRQRLVELFKFGVHYSTLFILKIWIVSAYLIRSFDTFVRRKLTGILNKNAHRAIASKEKPSEFLQDVQAHKAEIQESLEKAAEKDTAQAGVAE
jgi:hypothetical protein